MSEENEALEKRLERVEEKVDALWTFKNWVIGGAMTIAALIGLFIDQIKTGLHALMTIGKQ